MKPKIFTLKDFDFKPHAMVEGAVQGLLKLPNGITVSIVGGGDGSFRLCGDGVDTFEMAAWYDVNGDWIDLSNDGSDILKYVTKDEILFYLFELSQKKP